MTFAFWGLQGQPVFTFPARFAGYMLLLFELVLLAAIYYARADWNAWRDPKRYLEPANIVRALLVAGALFSATFVVRFDLPATATLPGLPQRAAGPSFAIFSDLPWLLAAGMLGAQPAAFIALLTGLIRAAWGTGSILTPLHFVIKAIVVAWLLRRDYLEWPGRLARNPLFSGAVGGLIFGSLRSLENLVYSSGSFINSLDYTLTLLRPTLLEGVLEGAIAGAIAFVLVRRGLIGWHQPLMLHVGPYNQSLAARLISLFIALGLLSSGILLYGDWLLARKAAQDLFSRQMQQAAALTSEAVPYFVQTGRAFASDVASSIGETTDTDRIDAKLLQTELRQGAFFQSLEVYDLELNLKASYPEREAPLETPFELKPALEAARSGAPAEVVLPPHVAESGAQIAFVQPVPALESGVPLGILVARTDVATNPLLQPIKDSFQQLSPSRALLVDEHGTILLSTGEADPLPVTIDNLPLEGEVTAETAPDGTRRMVLNQLVKGYRWNVLVVTPQSEVQELGLRIAVNLGLVLTAVGIVFLAAIYIISRRLTQPLRVMARAAQSIARGNLERPVDVQGEDEIGRLAASFERMRRRLKARLDEMGLLLTTSQGMAASFDLKETLPPILKGVQSLTRAAEVRLVLSPDEPFGDLAVYASEQDSRAWSQLDAQMLELSETRGRFVLENPRRARAILDIEQLEQPPQSLTAIPLRNEERFVGCLWLGYLHPHIFGPEEVRLLSILSGQLGIAVSNTRLYHQAEAERLRLNAVLETTPDAVLMLDQHGNILLANPAAEIVLKGDALAAIGKSIADWVLSPELNALLSGEGGDLRMAEVPLADGRVFYATVSELQTEMESASSKICVMWDITNFKKLDMLKSEFVATVSHDLRAPLTLMKGYATMLTMVGATNEQQKGFVNKILNSAEQMGELIDNLLDLGRIESGGGLTIEPVDVGEVIEDVASAYQPQAVTKQIDFEVEIAEHLRPIQADVTLLRQAIINLVDNALKYTPAGGEIRLVAEQSDSWQVIRVEDNGMGISPTDKARLFERFYRARRRETLKIRGSGLGLAIVKSVAEQHNGRVSVESKLGAGSVFTLEIPIEQPEPESEGAPLG